MNDNAGEGRSNANTASKKSEAALDRVADLVKKYVDAELAQAAALRRNLDDDLSTRMIRETYSQVNSCAKTIEALAWRISALERKQEKT